MTFDFHLRFRVDPNEDEGKGTLCLQYSTASHSLREAILRAMKEVHQQHPDVVFDGMTYFSKLQ